MPSDINAVPLQRQVGTAQLRLNSPARSLRRCAAALFGGSLVWYTCHKQAKEIGWMQSNAFFRHGMNNIAVMALCQSVIDHVNVPLVSIWPSCDRLRELLSLSLLQRAACAAWCCRESCTLPPPHACSKKLSSELGRMLESYSKLETI